MDDGGAAGSETARSVLWTNGGIGCPPEPVLWPESLAAPPTAPLSETAKSTSATT